MANRFFNQFGGTLERKVIKLFAKITYAAGAPTLVQSEVLNVGTSPITINPSQGFESLSPGANGRFTLFLGNNNGGVPEYDTYVRLLNVSTSQETSAGLALGTLFVTLVISEDVAGASGNPNIVLQPIVTSGGGPAEAIPADGTTVYVELTLSNTTAY
jgi:hypothetical protein